MRPSLADRNPRAICSKVLLPQPLGPMMAVTLPGSNRQRTLSSARVGVPDLERYVRPTPSTSMATAEPLIPHPKGLALFSRSFASVAAERSNTCCSVTDPLTSFMVSVQKRPCRMQDSMFGLPSSKNQVQRGAAASIRGGGTFVASEMILMTSGSLLAAALL